MLFPLFLKLSSNPTQLSPKYMPVVRKVKSKLAPPAPLAKEEPVLQVPEEKGAARLKKKFCQFHDNKTEPRYWDAAALRRFLNDRGRIVPRTRTGTCAKHQRAVTREIKRARHLAILHFTARI